jgi:hypothetical protein
MTVAPHLASQRRSLSLPAARRTTNAMTSRRSRPASQRRAGARPVHLRNQARPPSSVPTQRLRATALRAAARAPSASLKSP